MVIKIFNIFFFYISTIIFHLKWISFVTRTQYLKNFKTYFYRNKKLKKKIRENFNLKSLRVLDID